MKEASVHPVTIFFLAGIGYTFVMVVLLTLFDLWKKRYSRQTFRFNLLFAMSFGLFGGLRWSLPAVVGGFLQVFLLAVSITFLTVWLVLKSPLGERIKAWQKKS